MKKWPFPLLLFILLTFILAAAGWSIPLATTEEHLPMTVNITGMMGREIGFSVSGNESKELDFGSTFPGTTVEKMVNITRGTQPPAHVTVTADGAIAPWIEIHGGKFLLIKPVQVKVRVKVPEDAREGLYKGQLKIVYRKTLFCMLMG